MFCVPCAILDLLPHAAFVFPLQDILRGVPHVVVTVNLFSSKISQSCRFHSLTFRFVDYVLYWLFSGWKKDG